MSALSSLGESDRGDKEEVSMRRSIPEHIPGSLYLRVFSRTCAAGFFFPPSFKIRMAKSISSVKVCFEMYDPNLLC